MSRWFLAALLVLWMPEAFPCRTPVGGEFEANKRDRSEQRALVAELAAQADTIVIATTERIADKPWQGRVTFSVKEVLKGTPTIGDLLSYELSGEITVGCTTAASFRNPRGELGKDFVLYAQGGHLLRTGAMEREWPEISAKEELRRIRKVLKGA